MDRIIRARRSLAAPGPGFGPPDHRLSSVFRLFSESGQGVRSNAQFSALEDCEIIMNTVQCGNTLSHADIGHATNTWKKTRPRVVCPGRKAARESVDGSLAKGYASEPVNPVA